MPTNFQGQHEQESFQEDPASLDQAENLYTASGQAAYLKELVDDDINHTAQKRYQEIRNLFAVTSRNVKLSFLEEEDIDYLESLFHDAKLNKMMNEPAYKYDEDDQHTYNQMRMLLRASIRRGIGGDKDQMNERLALTTNISHGTQQQELSTDSPGRLQRIKQAFTGG